MCDVIHPVCKARAQEYELLIMSWEDWEGGLSPKQHFVWCIPCKKSLPKVEIIAHVHYKVHVWLHTLQKTKWWALTLQLRHKHTQIRLSDCSCMHVSKKLWASYTLCTTGLYCTVVSCFVIFFVSLCGFKSFSYLLNIQVIISFEPLNLIILKSLSFCPEGK